MRLLLDTHAFLWFVLDDPQLSSSAKTLIEDPANSIFVSPASYWELAIKIGQGKYILPEAFELFIERELRDNSIHILHILPKHAAMLTTLPRHHGDPFDRLLISQAIVENLPIIGADPQFDKYPVKRLW